MTDIRRESDRRAIEACRRTREDAVRLLGNINESGEGVDVTNEHAVFLRAVIERMDVALSAFEAL